MTLLCAELQNYCDYFPSPTSHFVRTTPLWFTAIAKLVRCIL
jgi:hypothetical protein